MEKALLYAGPFLLTNGNYTNILNLISTGGREKMSVSNESVTAGSRIDLVIFRLISMGIKLGLIAFIPLALLLTVTGGGAEMKRGAVLDDAQNWSSIATEVLQALGFNVTEFRNCEAFLAAGSGNFEVAVVDNRMPPSLYRRG